MRAIAVLAAFLVLGCASNGTEVRSAPAQERLTPESTVYLGAFAFNVENLHPVVIKECIPIPILDAITAVNAIAAEFENMQMTCEKQPGYPSYTCMNEEDGIIARVDAWKSLPKCMEYPEKMTSDMKALFNR